MIIEYLQKKASSIFLIFLLAFSTSIYFTSNSNYINVFNYLSLTVSGSFNSYFSNVESYFFLREQNQKLIQENIRLRSRLTNSFLKNNFEKNSAIDSFKINNTIYTRRYSYTEAQVIDNTSTYSGQVIQIFKGSKHGVKIGHGMISPEGIVGIVFRISNNYSLAYTILNQNTKVSSQIKNTHIIGVLNYDKKQGLTLQNISKTFLEDSSIKIGDTIVTSQYSTIFPVFLPIGKVTKIDKIEKSNFLHVIVTPFVDFSFIRNTYVVINRIKSKEL